MFPVSRLAMYARFFRSEPAALEVRVADGTHAGPGSGPPLDPHAVAASDTARRPTDFTFAFTRCSLSVGFSKSLKNVPDETTDESIGDQVLGHDVQRVVRANALIEDAVRVHRDGGPLPAPSHARRPRHADVPRARRALHSATDGVQNGHRTAI